MIKGFDHKGLKRLYEKDDARGISSEHQNRIENILCVLDSASEAKALDLPGYALHPLKGDLKGFWSVKVSGNWRITFQFKDGDAYDVDLIDYH